MFDDIGKHANVVAVISHRREGQIVDLAVDDLARPAEFFAGDLTGVRGIFDACHLQAAAGRLQKKVSVTATDFQQTRTRRDTVAIQQVEVLVGRTLFELIHVPMADIVVFDEKIVLAVNLPEFMVGGLRIGQHQLAIVTPHDAKTFHRELIRQAAALADRASGHRVAGGGRFGGGSGARGRGVAHRPSIEADFVPAGPCTAPGAIRLRFRRVQLVRSRDADDTATSEFICSQCPHRPTG